VCTICKTRKSFNEFNRNRRKNSVDGHHGFCMLCEQNTRLEQVFNISLEDYNNRRIAQGNMCAICGREESAMTISGKKQNLAVDHCHKTGKIRGLLCLNCNTALGQFQDNKVFLKNALKYIIKHEEK
jgi:hypothetical protein